MYLVTVSKYETKYIECHTKQAALLIAREEASENKQHNICVYKVTDEERRIVMQSGTS